MRASRRRRSTERHDTKDRWMITYADLITLLLIFFVIMYAMSQLDVDKYITVTKSLQTTFKSGGDSVLDGSNGIISQENIKNAKQQRTKGEQLTERELAFKKQEEQLANLMSMIELYIKANHLEDQIHIADLPKGISITLNDRFMFDAGKAELKSDSSKTLSNLANLFRKLNQTVISIEGHTDNLPIVHSSEFKDNWDLSGARALSVLRFFIYQEKLDPRNFQYAGFADTRPAADNTTPEGRQKNRRVEITVLRQLQK